MNVPISIASFICLITAQMFITFFTLIRVYTNPILEKKVSKHSLNFSMFQIPTQYFYITYSPLVKAINLFAWIMFLGSLTINSIYNSWWTTIIILVIGRFIGLRIMYKFISKNGSFGKTVVLMLIATIILITTYIYELIRGN